MLKPIEPTTPDRIEAGSSAEAQARAVRPSRRKPRAEKASPIRWSKSLRPVPQIPSRIMRLKDLHALMDATSGEVIRFMLDVVTNPVNPWHKAWGPEFAKELLKATTPKRKEISGAEGGDLFQALFGTAGQRASQPEPTHFDVEIVPTGHETSMSLDTVGGGQAERLDDTRTHNVKTGGIMGDEKEEQTAEEATEEAGEEASEESEG